jgi:hypothetical protein
VPCESSYIRAESTEHATWRVDKKHVESIIQQSNYTQTEPHDVRTVDSGSHRNSGALERMLCELYSVVI